MADPVSDLRGLAERWMNGPLRDDGVIDAAMDRLPALLDVVEAAERYMSGVDNGADSRTNGVLLINLGNAVAALSRLEEQP